MSNPNPKKLQVSTLRLRKKLAELADPTLRKAPQKVSASRKSISETTASVPQKPDQQGLQASPDQTPAPKQRGLGQKFAYAFPSLLILVELCGVIAVVAIAGIKLITPEADLGASCQGKLAGRWQTRWGVVTLKEDPQGQIKGNFTYRNVDRGLVKGELTGRLEAKSLAFNWQEISANNSKQRGNSIFVFDRTCREFYGRTHTLGNWRAKRL